MRNFIRTAIVLATFATPAIAFADDKAPAKDTKTAPADPKAKDTKAPAKDTKATPDPKAKDTKATPADPKAKDTKATPPATK